MVFERYLSNRSVITREDIRQYLDEHGSTNRRTQQSIVRYHVQKGRLLRVRRGLYVVVPPEMDPENCPVDPYLLASKATDDAVLAYETALGFHGKAHSLTGRYTYLTGTSAREFTFRSYRFQPVKFPKALRDVGKQNFGVSACDRAGQSVDVSGLERTLVDVLDRPELTGGWEEIWRSLESIEFFNLDTVVEYALLLDNHTTIAKTGYFLEQHRERLMVPDSHMKRLKKHSPKQPHYMDNNEPGPSQLETEWNLIVPTRIAEQDWEEIR